MKKVGTIIESTSKEETREEGRNTWNGGRRRRNEGFGSGEVK